MRSRLTRHQFEVAIVATATSRTVIAVDETELLLVAARSSRATAGIG
jgi:hypothetical protein